MKKKPSNTAVGSVLCLLLGMAGTLAAAPLPQSSASESGVPKRAKIVLSTVTKVHVRTNSKPVKPSPVKKERTAVSHAPSARWSFTPKIESRGREETTYGFLLAHPF